MKQQIRYILVGAFFGFILYKAEVISWYRIQEMFRFDSFHMYGVIGSGVAVGAIAIALLRKQEARTSQGEKIAIKPKPFQHGMWIGGVVFGTGWALTGACPGPMYAHLGAGTMVMWVALGAAIAGAWVYGLLRPRLPH